VLGGLLVFLAGPCVFIGGLASCLAPREAGARVWQWGLIGCVAWPVLFLVALGICEPLMTSPGAMPGEAVRLVLAVVVLVALLCPCLLWPAAGRSLGAPRVALGIRLHWALAVLLPFLAVLLAVIADHVGVLPPEPDFEDALALSLYVFHALLSPWLL